MKTIVYERDIDNTAFVGLIKQIEASKEENEFTIYFASRGGHYDAMECMVHYFDSLAERGKKIKLVAFHELSSAAFILFFSAKVDREILNTAFSVIHLPVLDANSVQIANDEKIFMMKEHCEKDQVSIIQWFSSLGFSEEELRQVLYFKNVIFDSERLKKIEPHEYKKINKENLPERVKNVLKDMR